MNTAKQDVQQLLTNLPDDASLEDIQYHLYVRQKIERGIADYASGNVLTEEEAEERIKKWLVA